MRKRPDRDGERRAPGRPARLSSALIAERACEIVRQRGLDALTMRSVAEALDATPMAIYHHVRGRDELVHLVVERVLAGIELPDEGLPPISWLREVAHRVRRAGLAHGGVMDVLLDEGPAVPSALRILDVTVSKLHAAGMGWDDATDVHNAFFSWLAATIRREDRWRKKDAEEPGRQRGFLALAESLSTDELPALQRALPRLRETNLDLVFTSALELLLSAVEGQLGRGALGRR